MKIVASILLIAAASLTGCAQDIASRSTDKRHVVYVTPPDYSKSRRMITGSNIPIRADQLTFGPVSATTPSDSLSRERPSLYPTVPIVGVSHNPEPRTEPANVGAGPAGSNPLPSGN